MGDFNRFGNMTPPQEMIRRPYLLAVDPFKIAGNLYFVGNMFCSCHLIDTGNGLILLDTPPIEQLPYLLDSIWKAGFDPRKIRHIIVSHAHVDHYGSVRALIHISGATTYISEPDAKDMLERPDFFEKHTKELGERNEGFLPDFKLKDGEIISIGNTAIRCVLTPGHTVGTMSHFWKVEEGGKEYKVGVYGGAGFITLSPKWWNSNEVLLEKARKEFSESIEKVWDEQVEIMLGNHPFHSDIIIKHQKAVLGDGSAFIDPGEWHRFLGDLKRRFAEFCKLSQQEIDEMLGRSEFETYQAELAKHAGAS